MGLFKSIFTWWDGPTWGTRLWSARHGEKVGQDSAGNSYYKRPAKDGRKERRWVIFNGENEASRVPPEWHGWLHYSHDAVPDPSDQLPAWVRPHQQNPTGTPAAYVRPGAAATGRARPRTLGDYEAWSPEEDAA